MDHFLDIADLDRGDIERLLDTATQLAAQPLGAQLAGRSVALLFLNPSLRTRTSFQVGIAQMGGIAVVLEPGGSSWGIEFTDGAVMDGTAEEHIAEVARVLSRYCDAIALRAFPTTDDLQWELGDPVIRSLARHATVPVINMETVVHPCQALAMAMTLKERFGDPRGRKFLLTWTWHPRPLNTAVANSALLMACKLGMTPTLLVPEDIYLLPEPIMARCREAAELAGQQLTVSTDIDSAYEGADFVYAKSWGAPVHFGNAAADAAAREPYRHFIVDEAKMAQTHSALFSHCLPLRRNVKATDGVMDADYCVAIDEAENRLHVQKAVLTHLLQPKKI